MHSNHTTILDAYKSSHTQHAPLKRKQPAKQLELRLFAGAALCRTAQSAACRRTPALCPQNTICISIAGLTGAAWSCQKQGLGHARSATSSCLGSPGGPGRLCVARRPRRLPPRAALCCRFRAKAWPPPPRRGRLVRDAHGRARRRRRQLSRLPRRKLLVRLHGHQVLHLHTSRRRCPGHIEVQAAASASQAARTSPQIPGASSCPHCGYFPLRVGPGVAQRCSCQHRFLRTVK